MDATLHHQPHATPHGETPHGATPPGETDQLAAAVLRSLGRSFTDQYSISSAGAWIGGLLTFGVGPLLKLHQQFRDYVMFEKQQLWHLAEWVRVRRGGPEAQALYDALDRVGLNPLFTAAKLAGVGIFLFAAFRELAGRFTLGRFIHETWRLGGRSIMTDEPLWIAWVIGLSVAYVAHIWQVDAHQRRLVEAAERFNALALREGVEPVTLPRAELGLNGGWVFGAALLSWFGGLWAIPMVLAGAGQRRYINKTATRFRANLLDRARTMIQRQRPSVAVPTYVIHGRQCDNRMCRALLKSGARFCSRCGAATGAGVMSEVA